MATPNHDYGLAINATIIGKEQQPGLTNHLEGGGWQRGNVHAPNFLRRWQCHEGHAVMGVALGDKTWADEPHFYRVVADISSEHQNVRGATLFALDFDNEEEEHTTLEQALADPILSTAALIYESASSRKKCLGYARFRCMWWLPQMLESWEFRALAQKMIAMWPGTDTACSNPNRVFYGNPHAPVHLESPFAVLNVDAVNARYAGDVESGQLNPVNTSFDVDPFAADVPGMFGCWVPGLFDWDRDEVGLAVHCLKKLPPRRDSSRGGWMDYSRAWRIVMALLNVFGPELAAEIIDEAGWHSEHWNLERVIRGSLCKIGKPSNQGRPPADMGTLIHAARTFGLTDDEIRSFKREHQRAKYE